MVFRDFSLWPQSWPISCYWLLINFGLSTGFHCTGVGRHGQTDNVHYVMQSDTGRVECIIKFLHEHGLQLCCGYRTKTLSCYTGTTTNTTTTELLLLLLYKGTSSCHMFGGPKLSKQEVVVVATLSTTLKAERRLAVVTHSLPRVASLSHSNKTVICTKSWPTWETPWPLDWNVKWTVSLCSVSSKLLAGLSKVHVWPSQFWCSWGQMTETFQKSLPICFNGACLMCHSQIWWQ